MNPHLFRLGTFGLLTALHCSPAWRGDPWEVAEEEKGEMREMLWRTDPGERGTVNVNRTHKSRI